MRTSELMVPLELREHRENLTDDELLIALAILIKRDRNGLFLRMAAKGRRGKIRPISSTPDELMQAWRHLGEIDPLAKIAVSMGISLDRYQELVALVYHHQEAA